MVGFGGLDLLVSLFVIYLSLVLLALVWLLPFLSPIVSLVLLLLVGVAMITLSLYLRDLQSSKGYRPGIAVMYV